MLAALKKALKSREEQTRLLEEKVRHFENELNKVSGENKKLVDSSGYQRRPPRIIREMATARELKEIIKDLEDEIADLQMNLRSSEVRYS